MKCEDIEERLSAYIDNELPKGEMATVEQHVLDCAACAKSLAQLKQVTNMVGDLAPVSMSDEASKRLETAIEERLRMPEPQTAPSEKPAWWRLFTRPAFGAVAASVAVLAIAVLVVSSPVQQSTDSMSELQERTRLSAPADREKKISPKIGEGRTDGSYSFQTTRRDIDNMAKELNEQPQADADNFSRKQQTDPGTESGLEDEEAKSTDKIDAVRAASIASKNTPFKLLSGSISSFENEEAWIITFETLDEDGDTTGRFRAAAVSTDGRLLYRTK
ncbi:MAG TPA: hypothetical protein ENI11_01035 [Actinobacteria bacterium]|nr:hypothetical protein [Actinomycetota bacterium]